MFIVVDEVSKAIRAVLDGPEITRWKTAADSAVAARMLSRQDSNVLLVLGAGPISRALIDAYLHIRPAITKVLLWNRTLTKLVSTLRELEARGIGVEIVQDLASASREADIISSATCSAVPLIEGRNVKPGTHVDLVGGFRPDMQEADIELMRRARIFVGDRSTAYASGDIGIPLASGAVTEAQIEGDLYELCQNDAFRRGPQDITVYKNAGGAHFDLIISQLVIRLLTYGTTAGCH